MACNGGWSSSTVPLTPVLKQLIVLEIQKVAKNAQDLKLRIAILGEVVLQGDDIVGDDVNITSRIKKIVAILSISGRVNAALERDPEFSTQYLGLSNLKGVSQKVKIFPLYRMVFLH